MRRALLLVPLLLVPASAGQAVLDTATFRLDLPEGATASATFELINALRAQDQLVFVTLRGPQADWAAVGRDRFVLPGGETANVTVNVTVPRQADVEEANISVEFLVINQATGARDTTTGEITGRVVSAPLVMGLWPPPPARGVPPNLVAFAAEVLLWIAIGVVAMQAEKVVVGQLAPRAPEHVKRFVARRISKPLFAVILVIGLHSAMRLLPPIGIVRSLEIVVDAALIAIVAYGLYRLSQAVIYYYSTQVAARTTTKLDDLLVPVLQKAAAVVIVVGAIYMFFQTLGVNLGVLIAGAGIAGLVIGFAAQDTLGNFFSGVFLLLDRPFRVGDDIRLESGEVVRVQHIGLRSTRLYSPKNHEIIVAPNNELANKRIANLRYPDALYRVDLPIGVSYGSDPTRVRDLLLEIAAGHPDTLKDESHKPAAVFINFGENSLDFVLLAWVLDERDRVALASDLRYRIFERFRAEGIEIPFPQRTVWLHRAGAD